jgi:hypothetical protein
VPDSGDSANMDGVPLTEAGNGHWHKNLYRARYRIVLLGAVLSSVVNEPLFSAVETHASIAPSLVKNLKRYEGYAPQETPDYLRQFSVYGSDVGLCEHAFERLTEWLVGDGKGRCVRDGLKGGDEGEEASTVHEIIHLLAAYEHLTKIVNGNPDWNLGRPQHNNQGAHSGDFEG